MSSSALPHHLVHLTILQTLSLHGFTSSQSSASLTLTDLLSRYLELVIRSAGEYANVSGRTELNVLDVYEALNEMGVGMESLMDFAWDFAGYGTVTGGEILKEKQALGLSEDESNKIHLFYVDEPLTPPSTHVSPEGDDDDMQDAVGEDEDMFGEVKQEVDIAIANEAPLVDENGQSVETIDEEKAREIIQEIEGLGLLGVEGGEPAAAVDQTTGMALDFPMDDLPLILDSLVPPSPEYELIKFLPPLPGTEVAQPEAATPAEVGLVDEAFPENAEAGPSQAHPSYSPPSYMKPLPFSRSQLASAEAEPLLPSQPTAPSSSKAPLSTTSLPYLLTAHKALQQGDQPTFLPRNQKRARAAWQLSLADNFSPTPSLFASISVPPPRSAGIVPIHPVGPDAEKFPYQAAQKTRPVTTIRESNTIHPANPYKHPNMLSVLASAMAPPSLLTRTTKMSFPPPLYAASTGEPLFYGPQVKANALKLTAAGGVNGGGDDSGEDDDDEDDDGRPKKKAVKKDFGKKVTVQATWEIASRDFSNPVLPKKKAVPAATLPPQSPAVTTTL